ncbi:sulfite exporter TauE/SafE family protein [Iamia majanohamensis]|uniref:Probable membrane transporter protein n=1 Tax=Iamia majanohamensis TaxID=467976 RepID=A0AAE9Y7G8_9ACTN|nr:sulfite exporter TauE/SafE family protein [Iamia majanohamensis]WCO68375.1 sulfite exporter TauE/SafE family protein [Iamia majanohamensis]
MTPGEAAVLALAGAAAGTINGAAGGGSLVSFPVLLALGYGSITANVTSTVGIFTGYVGGVAGYRRELEGQRDRVRTLLPVTVLGAVAGAALLLVTPDGAFDALVPWLILGACALFAAQPVLARRVAARREGRAVAAPSGPGDVGLGVRVATLAAAAYGAYFGAGLGVILLAVLGIGIEDRLIRLNGLRGVLALVANLVALVTFVVVAPVAWAAAGILAAGALVGGWLGARGARRLPPGVLRALVIVFGVVSAVRILVG